MTSAHTIGFGIPFAEGTEVKTVQQSVYQIMSGINIKEMLYEATASASVRFCSHCSASSCLGEIQVQEC